MSTEDSNVIEREHYVRLSVYVKVPDGLYIPIEPLLTEDERNSINSESLCTGAEVMHYLNDRMEDIGIKVEGISIMDTYTIETAIKR